MILKTFSPSEFIFEFHDIFEKHEIENQLILFNAENYLENEPSKDNVMGAIYDEDELILIFQNANPWNLLIFEVKTSFDAIQKLVQYLVENGIEIKGVNASRKMAEYFCYAYTNATKKEFDLQTPMDIMVLEELNDISFAKGSFEKASMDDLEQLATFHVNFIKDCFNEDHKRDEFYDKIERKIKSDDLFIFRNLEGKIVSMCGRGRKQKNSMAISLVYTLPEYRGKGYASTIVHHVCELILNSGVKYCTLFVDQTNPYSNKAYKKVGFKILVDNYDYRIK